MKQPITVYVCQRKQGPVCFVGSEIEANTHLHTCHGDSYPLYSVTPMIVGIAICAQGRAGHEYSTPQ